VLETCMPNTLVALRPSPVESDDAAQREERGCCGTPWVKTLTVKPQFDRQRGSVPACG